MSTPLLFASNVRVALTWRRPRFSGDTPRGAAAFHTPQTRGTTTAATGQPHHHDQPGLTLDDPAVREACATRDIVTIRPGSGCLMFGLSDVRVYEATVERLVALDRRVGAWRRGSRWWR